MVNGFVLKYCEVPKCYDWDCKTSVAHFRNNDFKDKMKNRLSNKLRQKNILAEKKI